MLRLAVSHNIAKVRETLAQNVLARTEIVAFHKTLPTKVIVIISIVNASLAPNNKVNAISVFGKRFLVIFEVVDLVMNLSDALLYLVIDLLVSLSLLAELVLIGFNPV